MRKPHNASDEMSVKRLEREQKDKDNDLLTILSTERGRRWVYGLVYDVCHISRPSFVLGDQHSTALNEGGRLIGEKLLEDIRTLSPKFYLKMHEEQHFDE